MIGILRNLIVRDFGLKLLSLVFAVIVWNAVSKREKGMQSPLAAFGARQEEQTYVNIPVFLVFPASEIPTVTVEPSEVLVTVRGDAAAIQNLTWKDIQARVDLTGIGSAKAMQKKVEITLPPGVVYTRVVPSQVDVTISTE